MSLLFTSRKALACLPAVCLLAVAVQSALKADLKITPKYDDSTVEVALIDPADLQPEPLPEPPPPEPEALPEPPPEPDPEPVVELPEPPAKPKPKPPEVKSPPPKPKPEVAKPVPKPAPAKPVVAKPVESKPAPAAPAVPAPAAPVVNVASLESSYIAALHAELEKHKQYPRGREASLQRPVGNVVVWLLIDRGGKVLDSGIEKKAASMLLNKAAQTSLRRIEQVRPFPKDVFGGRDKYRFNATLVYNIEN